MSQADQQQTVIMEADEESYYQSDSPIRGRKVVVSGPGG